MKIKESIGISRIIPLYNVEEAIIKAISSILN